ncbi:MAG: hypothetical protein R3C26_20750 [Calditrichia bacterium]
MIQTKDEFYYSQLEAIQNFYNMLRETDKVDVSLTELLSHGLPMDMRKNFEDYLRDHPYVIKLTRFYTLRLPES